MVNLIFNSFFLQPLKHNIDDDLTKHVNDGESEPPSIFE